MTDIKPVLERVRALEAALREARGYNCLMELPTAHAFNKIIDAALAQSTESAKQAVSPSPGSVEAAGEAEDAARS